MNGTVGVKKKKVVSRQPAFFVNLKFNTMKKHGTNIRFGGFASKYLCEKLTRV